MPDNTPPSRATFIQRKRLEMEQRRRALVANREWQQQQLLQKTCAHEERTGLTAARLRSGALTFYDRCVTCSKTLHVYKHESVPDPDAVPVERDDSYSNPPCAVCGAFGTELHHWAPKEFFDFEADHWPTTYLCVECHSRWHNIMRQQVAYKDRQQDAVTDARRSIGQPLGPYRGSARP